MAKSLSEALGGNLSSADQIIARKKTAAQAITERNVKATEVGKHLWAAAEAIQKYRTAQARAKGINKEMSLSAAAGVLKNYATEADRLKGLNYPKRSARDAALGALRQKYPELFGKG